MDEECCGGHGLPRRQVIRGGLAAAAVGALGGAAAAPGAALAATGSAGARAIDIHAHYYLQGFLDILGEAGKPYGLDYRAAPDGFFIGQQHYAAKFADLALRLAEMDQRGVGTHALSLTAPMLYWAPPELSERLGARLERRGERRASGASHALRRARHLADGRSRPRRRRARPRARLPGIRGVYLGTNIEDRDIDDPRFTPVFARIEALGLPVFLHPLKTLDRSDRMKPFYLANLIGNPLDTAIACAHLIFGGVMDRFPPHASSLPARMPAAWCRS